MLNQCDCCNTIPRPCPCECHNGDTIDNRLAQSKSNYEPERCRDSGAELKKDETLRDKTDIEVLQEQISELRSRMNQYEKMEWTSRPLNNLAASYCNLTNASKEQRDQLHVLEKRMEAEKKVVTDLLNRDIEHSERIDKLEKLDGKTGEILAKHHNRLKELEDWCSTDRFSYKAGYGLLDERIKALEASNATADDGLAENGQNTEILRQQVLSHDERIDKLETIYPRYDELHTEQYNRLEKLESCNTASDSTFVAVSANLNDLFRRIEDLEKANGYKHVPSQHALDSVVYMGGGRSAKDSKNGKRISFDCAFDDALYYLQSSSGDQYYIKRKCRDYILSRASFHLASIDWLDIISVDWEVYIL